MNKKLEEQMSLALDELLDSEAENQFQAAFADDPEAVNEWQCWQNLDSLLTWTPSAIPTPDFVDQFTLRLLLQERQRRLRQGFLVGILAFLLWGSMIVGAFTVNNFFFSGEVNPSSTIGQEFRSSAATVRYWLDNSLTTLNTMAGTPQALLAAIGYMSLAGFLLWRWVRLLRRSVHIQQPTAN